MSYNQEDKIKSVRKVPSHIVHIKNPSPNVQLAAVEENAYCIGYIAFPCYDAPLAAIYQDYNSTKFIKNIHPDIFTLAILMSYKPIS
jgi:hypothetical protein